MKCFFGLTIFLLIFNDFQFAETTSDFDVESLVCEHRESSLIFNCNLEHRKVDLHSDMEETKAKRMCTSSLVPFDLQECTKIFEEIRKFRVKKHRGVTNMCVADFERHKKMCPDSNINLKLAASSGVTDITAQQSNLGIPETGKQTVISSQKIAEAQPRPVLSSPQRLSITQQASLLQQQGIPIKQQAVLFQKQGVPIKQQAALFRQQGVSARQQATIFKQQGVSAKQQAVIFSRQGVPIRQQAAIFKQQGVPIKQQAAIFKQQGVSPRKQAVIFKQQGVSPRKQAAIFKQQGVPVRQQATIFSKQGVSIRQQATIFKQQGVSAKQQAEIFQRQGVPVRQQAAIFCQQGVPIRQQAAIFKQQGVSARQQASIFKQQGVSARQQASIFKQQGVPIRQQAAIFKQLGVPIRQQAAIFKQQGVPIRQQYASMQVSQTQTSSSKLSRQEEKIQVLINYIFDKRQNKINRHELAVFINSLFPEQESRPSVVNIYTGSERRKEINQLGKILTKLQENPKSPKLLRKLNVALTNIGKLKAEQKQQIRPAIQRQQQVGHTASRVQIQKIVQGQVGKQKIVPIVAAPSRVSISRQRVQDSLARLLINYIFGSTKLGVSSNELRQFIDSCYGDTQKSILTSRLHSILREIVEGYKPSALVISRVIPIKQQVARIQQIVQKPIGRPSVSFRPPILSHKQQIQYLIKNKVPIKVDKTIQRQTVTTASQNVQQKVKPVTVSFIKHILDHKNNLGVSTISQSKVPANSYKVQNPLSHLILDYIYGENKPAVSKHELRTFVDGFFKEDQKFIKESVLRRSLVDLIIGYKYTMQNVITRLIPDKRVGSIGKPTVIQVKPQVTLSKQKTDAAKLVSTFKQKIVASPLGQQNPPQKLEIKPALQKIGIAPQIRLTPRRNKVQDYLASLLTNCIFGKSESPRRMMELRIFVDKVFSKYQKSILASKLQSILMDLISGYKISGQRISPKVSAGVNQVLLGGMRKLKVPVQLDKSIRHQILLPTTNQMNKYKVKDSLASLLIEYLFGKRKSQANTHELRVFIDQCYTKEQKEIVASKLQSIILDLLTGYKMSIQKVVSQSQGPSLSISNLQLGSVKPMNVLLRPVLIAGKLHFAPVTYSAKGILASGQLGRLQSKLGVLPAGIKPGMLFSAPSVAARKDEFDVSFVFKIIDNLVEPEDFASSYASTVKK